VIHQSQDVPGYWIVDLDARLIERWHPEDTRPEMLTSAITWQPRENLAPLSIDLVRFFADVLD
jgi:hypothetical protein